MALRVAAVSYPDKGKYEGEVDEFKRNGKGMNNVKAVGRMQYANGDKYEGEWKDDLREGKGESSSNE